MMGAGEIALTILSFVVLGCLVGSLLWLVAWTMEDDDDG